MIEAKIGEEKVFIPTSWDEVTVKQYSRISEAKDIYSILEGLTSIEQEKWKSASETELILHLIPFMDFIMKSPEFDKLETPEYILIGELLEVPKNLGQRSFGQKIHAQKLIAKCFNDKKPVTSIMADLLGIYFKSKRQAIEEAKIIDSFPVFNFFCADILRLIKRDKKFLDKKPDAKMSLAGVEKLSKFNELRIIDNLAGGDMLKYNQVLEMEYDVVFKKLWYDSEMSDFRERYHKVLTKKAA